MSGDYQAKIKLSGRRLEFSPYEIVAAGAPEDRQVFRAGGEELPGGEGVVEFST